MISFKVKGNFNKIERFFKRSAHNNFESILRMYGELGVITLAMATPKDSGLTASSWSYEIEHTRGKSLKIYWTNSNFNDGIPIAILIQYGHGTRNGGYVQGRDYINPAIRPVFENMAENIWKEVTKI